VSPFEASNRTLLVGVAIAIVVIVVIGIIAGYDGDGGRQLYSH
jgi:hypothetical protein